MDRFSAHSRSCKDYFSYHLVRGCSPDVLPRLAARSFQHPPTAVIQRITATPSDLSKRKPVSNCWYTVSEVLHILPVNDGDLNLIVMGRNGLISARKYTYSSFGKSPFANFEDADASLFIRACVWLEIGECGSSDVEICGTGLDGALQLIGQM